MILAGLRVRTHDLLLSAKGRGRKVVFMLSRPWMVAFTPNPIGPRPGGGRDFWPTNQLQAELRSAHPTSVAAHLLGSHAPATVPDLHLTSHIIDGQNIDPWVSVTISSLSAKRNKWSVSCKKSITSWGDEFLTQWRGWNSLSPHLKNSVGPIRLELDRPKVKFLRSTTSLSRQSKKEWIVVITTTRIGNNN